MFKKIAVFGLGLLGGSLCKGLKKNSPGICISAYGRDVLKLEPALKDRYVDELRGYDEISLSGVDLAVVAMPIGASIELIKQLLDHPELRDDALVIDVGSVKEKIIDSIQGCSKVGQFIGCHPMAGSEKMGYEFSQSDLFDGASVIITPHPDNRDDDLAAIRKLWESLGSRTVIVSPREHDLFVTYTSHLPHMIAGSLISLLSNVEPGHTSFIDIRSFIGRGFMDVTRISSGSPDMWRDIILFNRKNILDAITRMIDELMRLRDSINDSELKSGELHDYFFKIKKTRDTL